MLQYLPYLSAGSTALGSIFSLIQQRQRNKQLEELRRYYSDPGAISARAQQYFNSMMPGANNALSRLAGDAASRGLSGSPNALAQVVASAYGPYQERALSMAMNYGQEASPFLTSPGTVQNPFDAFLKSLAAVRALQRPGSPPGATPGGQVPGGDGGGGGYGGGYGQPPVMYPPSIPPGWGEVPMPTDYYGYGFD
jgi:hypothetical protein